MKKRNPLKHYKTPKSDPVQDPDPDEVSFWLVKISPKIMAQIDERRRILGHNKKVTVTCMALAYLQATDENIPMSINYFQERNAALMLAIHNSKAKK